jgi:hypothetical protein
VGNWGHWLPNPHQHRRQISLIKKKAVKSPYESTSCAYFIGLAW